MTQGLVHAFTISLAGNPLTVEMQQLLVSVSVDSSLVDPGCFVLTFRDPDRTVITATGTRVGARVVIRALADDRPAGVTLIQGEVTGLDVEFSSAGSMTTIRGFDQIHRLLGGRNPRGFTNATYADVVQDVAGAAGVTLGQVDATGGVHDHVVQGNVSDWAFLRGLAREVGFELSVVDGKLNFTKPAEAARGPGPGTLDRSTAFQIVRGVNLLSLRGGVSAIEQVGQVEVRSWDPLTKKVIVGKGSAGTTALVNGAPLSSVAGASGKRKYSAVATGQTSPMANAQAKALAERIGGSSTELHAVVHGAPTLTAGSIVSLALVGPPFEGKYRVTSCRHVYDRVDGYTTRLSISGSQSRTLVDLTSGGFEVDERPGRIDGVVPAVIDDIADPKSTGRVKLQFPWLSDNYVSDWARTACPGAGPEMGSVVLSEVGAEVLVAFEHGDLRRPYVIGGLYGKDAPQDAPTLIADRQVQWRGMRTRTGHVLRLSDKASDNHITIETGDNRHRITLDQTNTTIEVDSKGKITIKGVEDVTVESNANLTLKARGKLVAEAGGSMELSAPTISIKGQGLVEVKGTPIQLN